MSLVRPQTPDPPHQHSGNPLPSSPAASAARQTSVRRSAWRLLPFWIGLALLQLAIGAGLWLQPAASDAVFAGLVAADIGVTLVLIGLGTVLIVALVRSLRTERRLREEQQALIDALPTGLALWSPDDRLKLINADFRRLYGDIGEGLMPGARFEDLLRAAVAQGLVPQAVADPEAWIAARLEQHRSPGPAVLRQMHDGRWRRLVEQRLPDGRLLSHSIDVTELMQAHHASELARTRLEDAIEALPAGFELYDAEDRLVLVNSLVKSQYPLLADLWDQGLTWEQLVRAHRARGGLLDIAQDFEAWVLDRHTQRRSDGPARLQATAPGQWISSFERRTRDGGLVGVRVDVSEQIEREKALTRLNAQLDSVNEELRRMAETDALTGLGNRRGFEKALATSLAEPSGAALLLLDVDHFKRYNDRYGHPAGDAVLRRIAGVLMAALRSPADVVARIGGEEFAVLLPGTNLFDASEMGRRCLALLADADIAHADSPMGSRVTASMGVAYACGVSEGVPGADLMQRADAALYRAKSGGRNQVVAA
jgi:diguanylate cyclase (GGDEF)-like protein